MGEEAIRFSASDVFSVFVFLSPLITTDRSVRVGLSPNWGLRMSSCRGPGLPTSGSSNHGRNFTILNAALLLFGGGQRRFRPHVTSHRPDS